MATIVLGSIREQLVNTAPPRGLFCDFPLGRPLGKPGDAAFQHRVLAHGFSLLERSRPSLEDFPERVADQGSEVLVCALPPRYDAEAHPAVDEARGLRAAYDRAVAEHGERGAATRTLSPDAIPQALEAFIRIGQGTPWKEARIPGIPARVAQDIRGYYETAALAIVDHTPAAWASARWYRDATKAGEVIRSAQLTMKNAGVRRDLWAFLLPMDSIPLD